MDALSTPPWYHSHPSCGPRLRLGDPVALLPILSFALLKFSRHVARFVVRSGFEVGHMPLGWAVLGPHNCLPTK